MKNTAQSYAAALYELAREEKEEKKILDDLSVISAVFKAEEKYLKLLNSYAVEKSEVYFSKDKKNLILDLTIDLSISSVMEYFEIFLTRMALCRKAAEALGVKFSVVINKNRIL